MNIRATVIGCLITMMFMLCETANADNKCMATAFPTDKNVVGAQGGIAWNDDKNIAKSRAIAACKKHNGGEGNKIANSCKIKELKCS